MSTSRLAQVHRLGLSDQLLPTELRSHLHSNSDWWADFFHPIIDKEALADGGEMLSGLPGRLLRFSLHARIAQPPVFRLLDLLTANPAAWKTELASVAVIARS
ncbi:MAG TPA: hypothetical protein DCF63_17440 [Planctomycetaceae bacterium]|nr:hypothetical protein [Planctomycetaceae bacterium]